MQNEPENTSPFDTEPKLKYAERIACFMMAIVPNVDMFSLDYKPSPFLALLRRRAGWNIFPWVALLTVVSAVILFEHIGPLLYMPLWQGLLSVWAYSRSRTIAYTLSSGSLFDQLRMAGIDFTSVRKEIRLHLVAQIVFPLIIGSMLLYVGIGIRALNSVVMFGIVLEIVLLLYIYSLYAFSIFPTLIIAPFCQLGIGHGFGYYGRRAFTGSAPIGLRQLWPLLAALILIILLGSIGFAVIALFKHAGPAAAVLGFIVGIHLILFAFLLFRKWTGHQAYDPYKGYEGMDLDDIFASKSQEFDRLMEEWITQRASRRPPP